MITIRNPTMSEVRACEPMFGFTLLSPEMVVVEAVGRVVAMADDYGTVTLAKDFAGQHFDNLRIKDALEGGISALFELYVKATS